MYIDGSPRLDAANELVWYCAKDVLAYLHQLRAYLLQTASSQYSTNHLPKLRPASQPLFNAHQRFPQGIVCICEGIGDWNDRLQKIEQLTLVLTQQHRIIRGYRQVHSQGNAEILLLRLINECLLAYEAAESMMDRALFEDRYGIVWIDDSS